MLILYAWWRRTFAWSNTAASWSERQVLAIFLALAAALGAGAIWLPVWVSACLWVGYLGAVGYFTRTGQLKLFGPVLFYDMICTARRSRYVLIRLIYAGILLGILCFMYLMFLDRHGFAHRHGRHGDFMLLAVIGLFVLVSGLVGSLALIMFLHNLRVRLVLAILAVLFFALFTLAAVSFNLDIQDRNQARNAAAMMGQIFFSTYMIVQLVLVVLLTPAFVAGAIAEEKDRKTLEFMLATDLNNHEIVLSKLLSRLANMTLFLLTGLPILSILQFLGGVDTELMLAGFAGTGLILFSLASTSILFSTLFQKPRDAIGMTYLGTIAYIALGTVAYGLEKSGMLVLPERLWFGDEPRTLAPIAQVINLGNPLVAVIEIGLAINTATLATTVPGLLNGFVWFHCILSAFCIFWAIFRLRVIALKQSAGGTTAKAKFWDWLRPPVGEAPMLWKEVHIEGKSRMNWVGRAIVIILVLLTLGTGAVVIGAVVWDYLSAHHWFWRDLPERMNAWFRTAGTSVASLLLLVVAVRASTSISGERDRDTFDALLTTPMSSSAMLNAKLIGCLMNLRLGWIWLGSMLFLAVVTGGVHLFAVPIFVVAWFVYATSFAMIGLFYSMVCKTSMRATVYTVLTTLLVGGGHWIIMGLFCYLPLAISRAGDRDVEYLIKFQAGMTPPFVLGFVAFSWDNLERDFGRHHSEMGSVFVFCLLGLFLWVGGCFFFWHGLVVPRFQQISRREELIYDDASSIRA